MAKLAPKTSYQVTLKALVVSVLLSLLVSWAYYSVLKSRISASNAHFASAFEQSFAAALEQYSYLPSILSRSVRVAGLLDNPNASHVELSRHFNEISSETGAEAIYLMNPEGTVIASSNFESEGSFYGKNYAFRPYFSQALELGQQHYYYAKGATTGIPGFFISSPVNSNQQIKGVVVIKLDLREWQARWGGQDSAVAVADEHGVVILSSESDWLYRLVDPLSDQKLASILDSKQFPDEALSALRADGTKLTSEGLGNNSSSQWRIDGLSYNVSRYSIAPPNWTFYFLLTHRSLLGKASWVFLASLLCLLLVTLLFFERRMRIESNQRTLLLESRQRKDLIALINNIEVGVFLCDQSGKVLTVNNQACKLLGKNESGLNGRNIRRLIQFDSNLMESQPLESMSFTDTVSLGNDLQRLPVMVSTRPVMIEDQPCNLVTAVNIERRKQAERELLALNESLEELVVERTQALEDAQEALVRRNKVMALGNLSAVVVHELSQPLSAMNSLVATIQNKLSSGNMQGVAESAKRIEPISQKMDGIIKMLKSYSYFNAAETEICELGELIDHSVELLRETLSENDIALQIAYADQPIFVKVNRLKFDLLISNIIRNAIDAVSEKAQPKIVVQMSNTSDNAMVVVSDNGDGIDDMIIEHLFDAFQTTKQVGKGMGLGLSVANEIASEFGGQIEAKNRPSGGEFSVSLPVASMSGEKQSELVG